MYDAYCTKVRNIVRLNPKSKIVVVPALPTKSAALNKRVLDFDDLLINNLPQACRNVTSARGVSRFVDSHTGLLKEWLSKHRDDALHINESGRALLVRLVKDELYKRKQGKTGSRPWNHVANVSPGGLARS